jgi:hypothetical protein
MSNLNYHYHRRYQPIRKAIFEEKMYTMRQRDPLFMNNSDIYLQLREEQLVR